MNRKQEIEKYLMPLLPEEPEEITATALQREYKNGYLDGQKKAYDECDEIARELSQIKSGCSKWLDKHDAKIRAYVINKFVVNAITEFQKFDKEHGYPTLGDISDILSDVAEQLKEEK